MPRPKVKPMDRQRSVRACVSCKRSKIRCDAEHPCAMCKRRGRAEECIYEPAQSRRASRVSQDASLKSPATEVDSVIQQSSTTSTKRLRIAEEPAEPSNDGASQDEQIESPRSRMLLSAKLHKGMSHGIVPCTFEYIAYLGVQFTLARRHRYHICNFCDE